MQEALSEQIQLSATIAQPFEQLHPTDLPLALARAPGRGQRGHDRLIILAQTAGQGAKRRELRGLSRWQPLIEPRWIMLGSQGVKAGLQLVSTGERGGGVQVVLHTLAVGIRQALGRLQEPPGELRWGERGWAERLTQPRPPRLALGQIGATRGALYALEEAGQDAIPFVRRNQSSDWGESPEEDRRENAWSLPQRYRVLSAYTLGTDAKIWIITEGFNHNCTLERTEASPINYVIRFFYVRG